MKASIGCALAVLAGACLAVRVEAQSIVVGPQANSMAILPGALVTVPIVADLTSSGGRSLGSVTARLSWRPGVLALRGVGAGTLGPPTINVDSAAGTLRFALANAGGVVGQPILLNATFAVLGTPGASDTLRVSLQELVNAGTFVDLLPIGQTTPATLCVSTGLFGDLDESGTVNSFDALLIVTNAVGLPIAPRTTANGDVDGDGQVSTRDALIVLTHAVGLPVGGFRVARVNPGACTIRTAASVEVAPRSVAVVSGDRVPLTATVRDSSGATIQGTGLVWTSADTTIAKADLAGNVIAAGSGGTLVFANVAPGLKDSVAVTVGSTRRVWYVDQLLAAANGGVETGSAQYPFGALQTAVDRAAADDTVRVAPAVYDVGARITRPLVVLGDSTAAGTPTFGGAIAIDSLPGGSVVIRRIRIVDAPMGVMARGLGAGRVELELVVVERSRGLGVGGVGLAELRLTDVQVQGAVGEGIGVDSSGYAHLERVQVDAVSAGTSGSTLEGIGFGVSHTDSVRVDSVAFRLGTLRFRSVGAMRMRHVRLTEAIAALLDGDSLGIVSIDTAEMGNSGGMEGDDGFALNFGLLPGGTLRLQHVSLGMLGRQGLRVQGGERVTLRDVLLDGPGIGSDPSASSRYIVQFVGVAHVAIAQSWIGYGFVGLERACSECAGELRVDTTAFQKAPVLAMGMDTVLVRRSSFADGPAPLFTVETARVVSFVESEVSQAWPVSVMSPSVGGRAASALVGTRAGPAPAAAGMSEVPFAVALFYADSARVDSSWVHGNAQGAVVLGAVLKASLIGNHFDGNHTYGTMYGPTIASFESYEPDFLRLAQNRFGERDGMSMSAYVAFDTEGASGFVADSNTIERASLGFEVMSPDQNDTAVIRGTAFLQAGSSSPTGILALFEEVASARVLGNSVDTSMSVEPQVTGYAQRLEVRGNTFLGVGAAVGLGQEAGGDSLVVVGNTVRCGPTTGYSEEGAPPLLRRAAHDLGANPAIRLSAYDATTARVDSNEVRGCRTGIQVTGTGTIPATARVRRNLVVPDSASGQRGISLSGALFASEVARNEVGPGQTPGGAIRIEGSYSTGPDSTLVTQNSVHDVWGVGIGVTGAASRTTLDGDTVRAVRYAWADYDACGDGVGGAVCINVSGTANARARIRGAFLAQNRAAGIRFVNSVDTLRIDSTVVVDDSLAALAFGPTTGLAVAGGWNFFARNATGIQGSPSNFVRMSQSVFQQNVPFGVQGALGWKLVDNYWGDALGPRCDMGCNASSVGDYAYGVDSTSVDPFLPTAPATPAGTPPALRAKAVTVGVSARPAPGATRAVRPERLVTRSPAAGARWREEVRP